MKSTLTLIVAGQGALQEGLIALLTSIPQISAVLVAEEASSGLRMLKDHRPRLVLLDMDLPQHDAQMIVKWVKSEGSAIRWIALVNNVAQEQTAQDIEADAVLVTGFEGTKLIAVIEELLS